MPPSGLLANCRDIHRMFLGSLSPFVACGDFFSSPAGVKPGVPLPETAIENLPWIREDFLVYEGDFGKILVHWHAPVREPDIRPNRINIDTGAYATGRLTCLVIAGSSRTRH
jgi:hypothetical protein